MPQLMKLLNSKCPYCHFLKVKPAQKHRIFCKLRLLSLGLVEKSEEIDTFTSSAEKSKMKNQEGTQDSNKLGTQTSETVDEEQNDEEKEKDREEEQVEEEGDEERLLREDFVKDELRKYKQKHRLERVNPVKLEIASSKRRELVKELLSLGTNSNNCGNCKG